MVSELSSGMKRRKTIGIKVEKGQKWYVIFTSKSDRFSSLLKPLLNIGGYQTKGFHKKVILFLSLEMMNRKISKICLKSIIYNCDKRLIISLKILSKSLHIVTSRRNFFQDMFWPQKFKDIFYLCPRDING